MLTLVKFDFFFCFWCLLKLDTGCHPSCVRLLVCFHLFVSVSRPMQFSSPLMEQVFLSACYQFCNQKFWLDVLEWVMVERIETLFIPHMQLLLFHKLVRAKFCTTGSTKFGSAKVVFGSYKILTWPIYS